MALPVTITGLSLDMATVGPYQSSGGNYYLFGRDASTTTTLVCMKATDPTVSWSSIATDAGFSYYINNVAACQDGDIIHLVVCCVNLGQLYYYYRTFNMATDAFAVSETIISPITAAAGTNYCDIVVRSGAVPVVILQAASSGFAKIYYSLRVGADNWSAPVEVDDGGSKDYSYPVAILGNSDEIQFVYYASDATYQKALNSSNELQTATTATAYAFSEGISYDLNGTTKCIVACRNAGLTMYFNAGDSPTLNFSSLGTINFPSLRLVASQQMAYALYSKSSGGNNDYYIRSTDDGGAHWSPETLICSATNSGLLQNTSRFNKIYKDITDIIFPFVYADASSTELKHNHKVVRSTILQGLASFIGGGIFTSTGLGGNFTAPLEDPFRLRFSILNEGGNLDAAPWQLYVSKNGDAYHAVTTTSDDARSVNAGSSPDETQIFIPRLTIPA